VRSGRACLGSDGCQLLMVLVVPFAGIVSMAHPSPCMAWRSLAEHNALQQVSL
jgi:hypothetical protein